MGEIPLADWLHIADAFAAVDVESDDQESVDLGPCAAVDVQPTEHVGEREVAVDDARGHGVAFDAGAVSDADGVELDHWAV